jgi:hypothetical protein
MSRFFTKCRSAAGWVDSFRYDLLVPASCSGLTALDLLFNVGTKLLRRVRAPFTWRAVETLKPPTRAFSGRQLVPVWMCDLPHLKPVKNQESGIRSALSSECKNIESFIKDNQKVATLGKP